MNAFRKSIIVAAIVAATQVNAQLPGEDAEEDGCKPPFGDTPDSVLVQRCDPCKLAQYDQVYLPACLAKPVITRGDIKFINGATIDFDGATWVPRAGPFVGFIRAKIGGREVLLQVFMPERVWTPGEDGDRR